LCGVTLFFGAWCEHETRLGDVCSRPPASAFVHALKD
jgi:hypothetical protein